MGAYAREVPDPTETAAAPAGPVWAVVVAGGAGSRFGGAKQYVELVGRPVLDWSVAAAATVADGIVVVVPDDHLDRPVRGADHVVAGGPTRAASVRNGLEAVPDDAEIVVVHDAARPAATASLFARVVGAVGPGADGVVPVVGVADSLRSLDGGVVDRSRVVAVQTPQAFRADWLRAAHESGGDASDDATLVEQAGGSIELVDGEPTNVKLTHPHDRVLLEHALHARSGIPR